MRNHRKPQAERLWPLTISISDELRAIISARANEEKKSMSAWIVQTCRAAISDKEMRP